MFMKEQYILGDDKKDNYLKATKTIEYKIDHAGMPERSNGIGLGVMSQHHIDAAMITKTPIGLVPSGVQIVGDKVDNDRARQRECPLPRTIFSFFNIIDFNPFRILRKDYKGDMAYT